MATPQQIDEQVKLERQDSQDEQLRKNTKQLEHKQYASATVYGITSLIPLPLVIEDRRHYNPN